MFVALDGLLMLLLDYVDLLFGDVQVADVEHIDSGFDVGDIAEDAVAHQPQVAGFDFFVVLLQDVEDLYEVVQAVVH